MKIRYLLPTLCLLAAPVIALADSLLYELLSQRLSLMQAVASAKWANQTPIEDKTRELVVIENAVTSGLKFGITKLSSERFFRAQIEAAKDIQHCWFDRWTDGQAPGSAPSLDAVIRPRLITLGSEITARLVHHVPDEALFLNTIKITCLSDASRDAVFAALSNIERYPDQLTQIVDTGVIRIGTTGDYAPFSFQAADKFTGIDIDLAQDLAASLNVTPRFIKTSWPNLVSDLKSGAYDIAMSGVSRTAERALVGHFSYSYHVGGKTPITRCDQVSRFDDMNKIDRTGVRIIVNPGGTNEKFLNTHIRHATRIMHQDNRTIFAAIINNEADLMITDRIEVTLQSGLHKELCPSMPVNLTYQEKAYLMPQDELLLHAVNLWLEASKRDGSLKRVFDRHLNP